MGQKSKATIARAIVARERFSALKGNMSGKWLLSTDHLTSSDFGWLANFPEGRETIAEMRELLKDRDLYVIYSYRTPIAYAWNEEIVMLPHKYTSTTSGHQTIARSPQFYADMLNRDGSWANH